MRAAVGGLTDFLATEAPAELRGVPYREVCSTCVSTSIILARIRAYMHCVLMRMCMYVLVYVHVYPQRG